MRILITNYALANRAGSELYVRDLAISLRNRGHDPIVYSTQLGAVAEDIRAADVPVIDDLDALGDPPDIIHGHHHLETMTALLRLPLTPAIFVCHGSVPWDEAAPRFPRIRRYVAVDHACRDRLLFEHAIPANEIRVILNFVDLKRFRPRSHLPARPERALIFSNQANQSNYVNAIRLACEGAGLTLHVVGKSSGNVCIDPAAMLGNYDIVFAKGRAALEALAVGTAVIVCDTAGAGPMVTTANLLQLRPLNFGIRTLSQALTPAVISREIARYDPADAARVSDLIRATASRDAVIDDLLSLYREVIDEHNRMPNQNLRAEQNAVADYLRELAPRLRAAELLPVREEELARIRSSRSWRLISGYAAIRRSILAQAQRFWRHLPGAKAARR